LHPPADRREDTIVKTTSAGNDITRLLGAVRHGEPGALDQLFEIVYHELHRLAHYQAGHRWGHAAPDAFNTTTLVHETYLKLVAAAQPDWVDRRHFYHVAARAMRQIIIDRARRALADKRGAGAVHVSLEHAEPAIATNAEQFLALEQALNQLTQISQRLAQVVELHFYAGLTFQEIGAALELSERTIKRDWRLARAYLYRYLGRTA